MESSTAFKMVVSLSAINNSVLYLKQLGERAQLPGTVGGNLGFE